MLKWNDRGNELVGFGLEFEFDELQGRRTQGGSYRDDVGNQKTRVNSSCYLFEWANFCKIASTSFRSRKFGSIRNVCSNMA